MKPILVFAFVFVLAIAAIVLIPVDTLSDVEFKTITGERLTLGEQRGKTLLVTFWATDCPACMDEIPELTGLHNDYKNKGLVIIAVAMPYDPPNRVVEFARNKKLPYRVALDPAGTVSKAFGDVQLIPRSFLISPKGEIKLDILGKIEAMKLKSHIEPLLNRTE